MHAIPGRNANVHTFFQRLLTQIFAPIPNKYGGVNGAGKRIDTKTVVSAVDNRTNITRFHLVYPDCLKNRAPEISLTVIGLHPIDFAGINQPINMVFDPKNRGSVLRLITSHSAKERRSVMDYVGSYVDLA